jgi:hypothetical protein
MSTPDRRAMLDRNHLELSVRRQCALLSLARSGVYRPVPTEDEADLALMRRIDELFLAHPFLGSRRMAKMLLREGAREPQAGAAPDAADGHRGTRAEAEHLEAGAGAHGLSLPVAGSHDRAAQPGLGSRHYLDTVGEVRWPSSMGEIHESAPGAGR